MVTSVSVIILPGGPGRGTSRWIVYSDTTGRVSLKAVEQDMIDRLCQILPTSSLTPMQKSMVLSIEIMDGWQNCARD